MWNDRGNAMQKKGMELEGLVKSGDVVLAGVSGGADSVCLLLMLLEYRKHCDFFPGGGARGTRDPGRCQQERRRVC